MREIALAVVALIGGWAGVAAAQNYPSRPVTMVVPFAAGGGTDTIARILAERMRASFGQPVIVDNASGANGTLGVGRVARAAPDGHTISIGNWTTHVANGALYGLPYDLLRDFEPVTLISTTSWLIMAKKAVPANDLNGFIGWLKANSGRVSAGTAGIGSGEHVSGLLFQKLTGTHFQFVPYRGGAPAMQDLVAGQIDMMISGPTLSLPQVRAGGVKAYAVTAKMRLAAAPDIPTVDEAGAPGFYFSYWHALWVAKGTPNSIIGKINRVVTDALADPAVVRRLAELGQQIVPREQQTPEALGVYQRAETNTWGPLIKAANIKGD
jgi:tripartite-type tricarboxylate transporter receptor subunit TctC